MGCTVVESICLLIGENKPYGLDLTKFCTNYFAEGEYYALTERVRPREIEDGGKGPNGFEYEVTTAGQTGSREPIWPTTIAATVTSGSVTFTCRAISNSSLTKTISSSTWSVPTGITADDDSTVTSNGEQKTAVFLEATAAVTKEGITNTVTFSDGHVEEFVLRVSAS